MELVQSKSMDAVLAELQLCPLVEIVHFHKVLRGEMMAVVQLYRQLRPRLDADVLCHDVHKLEETIRNRFHLLWSVFQAHSSAEDNTIWPALQKKQRTLNAEGTNIHDIVEGHEDEEKCFKEISNLLQRLHNCLDDKGMRLSIAAEAEQVLDRAAKQLLEHLAKEETEVLPCIQKCFTHEEMAQLVGQIMGHRSSDIMQAILGMMVQHLSSMEREHMLKHMQTAVKDTYFARWLSLLNTDYHTMNRRSQAIEAHVPSSSSTDIVIHAAPTAQSTKLNAAHGSIGMDALASSTYQQQRAIAVYSPEVEAQKSAAEDELRAAIKAIAKCDGLSSEDKTRVMQCLQMSHSKRHLVQCDQSGQEGCRSQQKRSRTGSGDLHHHSHQLTVIQQSGAISTDTTRIVHSSSDLQPSYQTPDGVLGCSHYARGCRLLAPCCNRLYVCRLCHDESSDHALDRFSVKQVLCMRCNTLQPSGDSCRNSDCGASFARYYCDICHLFDDDASKSIYHCPYCNVCRKGKGLGEDFYHCMRCNACIRLENDATHSCLSHSMERSCPICQRYLFDSVEVLKGLKCGHVMHLSCFMQYRIHKYYCPLCHQTMEDMSHEWDMIDNHLRTSGLPAHLVGWQTRIHCYDCNTNSTTQYRLDYHKCTECASYNTRTEGAPSFVGTPQQQP